MKLNFNNGAKRAKSNGGAARNRKANPAARLVDPLRSKAFLEGVRDWRWLNIARYLEGSMGRLAMIAFAAALFAGMAAPVRACGPSMPGPLSLFFGLFDNPPASVAMPAVVHLKAEPAPRAAGGCCPILDSWRKEQGAQLVVQTLSNLPQ